MCGSAVRVAGRMLSILAKPKYVMGLIGQGRKEALGGKKNRLNGLPWWRSG